MQGIGMKNKGFKTADAAVCDPTHWVAKYADYLYSYALARLDDEELCRDLVQETFLAALERLGEFRGESSERTWLTAILRYKTIDVYRKKSSGLIAGNGLPDAEPEYFEPDNGHWKEIHAPRAMSIEVADPVAQKELAAILQKCLRLLPALWFSVFKMKYMDEEATEVVLSELRISPANFWVILHRAKVNLRACLQRQGL